MLDLVITSCDKFYTNNCFLTQADENNFLWAYHNYTDRSVNVFTVGFVPKHIAGLHCER